jgi:hypothetical protein
MKIQIKDFPFNTVQESDIFRHITTTEDSDYPIIMFEYITNNYYRSIHI